jgi:hypothetical protein
VDLIQRIVEAGNPVSAEQLRIFLAGCDVEVTSREAERIYSRYNQTLSHEREAQLVTPF